MILQLDFFFTIFPGSQMGLYIINVSIYSDFKNIPYQYTFQLFFHVGKKIS